MSVLFGRYEYAGELGRGATGRVFRALDRAEPIEGVPAPRAIKVVSAADASRLAWEFARLGEVAHPRVARVRELLRVEHDVPAPLSLSAGAVLLVEDFVAGEPLARVLGAAEDARARRALAVEVGLGIAEALGALHMRGLVHGDVKPDNVLCDPRGGGATLVDLGFARPPSHAAVPRGTPAYMAPELFAGVCTPAADVYALGALLFDCLRGELPSARDSLRAAPWRTPDLAQLGDVDGAFVGLLAALLAPSPEARPADADAALSRMIATFGALGLAPARPPLRVLGLARSASERAARARTLPLVGHDAALAALAGGLDGAARVCVQGPEGAGRTRVVREAIRRHQEARALAGGRVPTLVDDLAALSSLRDVDAVLVLDAAHTPEVAARIRAAELAKLSLGRLCVVTLAPPGAMIEGATQVRVGALDEDDEGHLLAALLAPDRPTQAVREAAHRTAGGLSGRLCALAESLLAAGRDLHDPRVWAALATEQRADLVLSPVARRLVEALAWCGPALSPADAARSLGGEAEARQAHEAVRAAGLLTESEDALPTSTARRLRAESRAHAEALIREIQPENDAPWRQRGFVLVALGEHAAARDALAHEAASLRATGHSDAACALLDEARTYLDDSGLTLLAADSERAAGRYARALARLDNAEDDAARLARAELLRLADRPDDARALLAALIAEGAPTVAARARALRARLEFDAGATAAALADVNEALSAWDLEAEVRALEVQLLLALLAGTLEPAPAERLLARATATSAAQRRAPSFLARAPARAQALAAQLWLARGERVRGLAALRTAVAEARALGEAHEAATYALNLGLLEYERGELGAALEVLHGLAPRLAEVARERDLARVLLNLAGIALLVGDLERAELALREAERSLGGVVDHAARALDAVLRAELATAGGALELAERTLTDALATLPETARASKGLLASRLAQAAAARGALDRAEPALGEASTNLRDDAGGLFERLTATLRVALAASDLGRAEAAAREGLARLDDRIAFAERLRFVIAAVECARVAHPVALAERAALARGWLEQAIATLPPSARASMRAVPAHARILADASPRAQLEAPERWRALVRASRRLFREPRPARVAQRLADVALELVHAERALVITFDDAYALTVVARAELGGQAAPLPAFSRSVVEQVALEGAPLVTVEARSDARLDRAASVHALSLRSVLCVALGGLPQRAFLYLDDRLRPSAFGPDDLALLVDLAELAREALASAALLTQAARRARRAEQRERRLGETLSAVERGAGEAEVPLIGHSLALARVIDAARRVARADAPVLVEGESGTGKELLARFLHDASPRRARAFVAESCAALPDTLLESALFGHVRGAFTGADRARKGLFETADGGTLFLDEVGEMSPALQGKLLRVLQEGELRPLGSERTRSVDVRVVAATRRDLLALVRAGRFREDLYYRLAVVTLALPSLRERPEDIPELVAHLVKKHAGERRVRVHPSALAALTRRAWPGNVRELENALRRALALCDDEIALAHLSGGDLAASTGDPAELDLHARTEQLTRELVETALARAEGNVTRAAALLGVSRFGLQKMLKRYPRAK